MFERIRNNLTSQKKTSHGLFIALLILCCWASISATMTAFDMVGKSFPGFGILDIGDGYLYVNGMSQPHWSGMQNGLQFQDIIKTVEGELATSGSVITDRVNAVPVGTPLKYQVVSWKDNTIKTLTIPTDRFTWRDFWLVFGLPFLSAFVLIDMAVVVYILRPFASGSWGFIIFTLALSIYCVSGFEASFNYPQIWLFWLAGAMIPASLFHLASSFPEKNIICQKYRVIVPIVYGLGLTMAFLPFSPFITTSPTYMQRMLVLSLITAGIVGLFFFISLFRSYFSCKQAGKKNITLVKLRIKVLLIGAILAFVVPGFLALMSVSVTNFFIPFNYISPLLLIFPLTATFAIVQYNLFGVDNYIKRGLSALFFTGTTIAIYFLSVVLLEQWGHPNIRQSPLFTLGFTLLIVVLFTPLNQLLQSLLGRWLSRNRKTYQELINELSQKLTTVLTREEILDILSHFLIDELGIRSMSIWLKSDSCYSRYYQKSENTGCSCVHLDPESIATLEELEITPEPIFIAEVRDNLDASRHKKYLPVFDKLDATLILPLIFRKELVGAIILGEKESAQPYSADDLDLLNPLSYQVAIALENAKFYETIQELNENLEQKVQERTQELMKTIQEKEQTRQQLIRSESLAAIGQLVAGVAHELNNPLGSAHSLIQSVVEILEEKEDATEDEEDIIDDLKFVLKEQTRAKDIVSSLLDLSRQTQSYEEPVQLNQVIEDATRILHNKYKYQKIKIETNLDKSLPVIYGNFAQLGQVFINIIQNAVQAVPPTEGQIVLETKQENNLITFRCKDNGAGIPDENLQNIFKPFFTTKPVGEGTGLGLYICHDIIERHQGTIKVHSNHKEGTVFEINLPITTRVSNVA